MTARHKDDNERNARRPEPGLGWQEKRGAAVCLPPSRASRAAAPRATGTKKASAEQLRGEPAPSQGHTRMVRVAVLLWAGNPLSSTTTGRTYTSCNRCWKPLRRDTMPAFRVSFCNASEGSGRDSGRRARSRENNRLLNKSHKELRLDGHATRGAGRISPKRSRLNTQGTQVETMRAGPTITQEAEEPVAHRRPVPVHGADCLDDLGEADRPDLLSAFDGRRETFWRYSFVETVPSTVSMSKQQSDSICHSKEYLQR
ncbi:hypothetical protein EYF80_058038 [Liparis tanakae]|uniref:Uncharacterized protein n=1 Tax=Liparis tanakae TaxID=230148 RepID=A0A4Z2ETV3_9TELE|nr:hypothetical protein EYF80_058038 [Liparis tanakae]